jgi:hypothetical protein
LYFIKFFTILFPNFLIFFLNISEYYFKLIRILFFLLHLLEIISFPSSCKFIKIFFLFVTSFYYFIIYICYIHNMKYIIPQIFGHYFSYHINRNISSCMSHMRFIIDSRSTIIQFYNFPVYRNKFLLKKKKD